MVWLQIYTQAYIFYNKRGIRIFDEKNTNLKMRIKIKMLKKNNFYKYQYKDLYDIILELFLFILKKT